MAEFAELNKRLTSAVKSRLGETVVLAPVTGGEISLRAIVRRGVELIGNDARMADRRDIVGFDDVDVAGLDLSGAALKIGADEQRVLDALVVRDGGMVEWALR